MVIPLIRVDYMYIYNWFTVNYSRLFKKVVINLSTLYIPTVLAEIDVDEFTKSRRIIISSSFSIPECFEQGVSCKEQLLNRVGFNKLSICYAFNLSIISRIIFIASQIQKYKKFLVIFQSSY